MMAQGRRPWTSPKTLHLDHLQTQKTLRVSAPTHPTRCAPHRRMRAAWLGSWPPPPRPLELWPEPQLLGVPQTPRRTVFEGRGATSGFWALFLWSTKYQHTLEGRGATSGFWTPSLWSTTVSIRIPALSIPMSSESSRCTRGFVQGMLHTGDLPLFNA